MTAADHEAAIREALMMASTALVSIQHSAEPFNLAPFVHSCDAAHVNLDALVGLLQQRDEELAVALARVRHLEETYER